MDGKQIIEKFYDGKEYISSFYKDSETYSITFISSLVMTISFSSLVKIRFNNREYYELDEQDLWGLFYELEDDTYVCINEKKSFLIDSKEAIIGDYDCVFSIFKKIK